jgi:hypothetical protein
MTPYALECLGGAIRVLDVVLCEHLAGDAAAEITAAAGLIEEALSELEKPAHLNAGRGS